MAGPMPTPLTDVRVLEIGGRIAGAYCGKLFRDAGAAVVKVEPHGGDPLRRYSATRSESPPGVDSPLFGYLNAGKRSVVADPSGPVVAELMATRRHRGAHARAGPPPSAKGGSWTPWSPRTVHASSSPSPTSVGRARGRSAQH